MAPLNEEIIVKGNADLAPRVMGLRRVLQENLKWK
jgi:hypothetical protein